MWLGFRDLLDYVLITSIFGGALTIVLIGLRNLPVPAAFFDHGWLARLRDPRSGIPYGVALAAGALAVLPHTEVFFRAVA